MPRLDPATLHRLFAEHLPALTLFARQCLPDATSAQDVVQEVFVRLLERLADRRLDWPANPSAFLHLCVKNACLDDRRAEARRKRWERQAGESRSDWFEPHPADPLDARAAADALARLDRVSRQIVVLRIWSGLGFSEIAGIVDLATSTVHERYQAALRDLRDFLEPQQSHERLNART